MANFRKSPLIKELVEALASIDLADVRRADGTGMLGDCIRSTCRKLRYRCLPEYPAGLIQGRNTYIDFVCSQRSGIGKTYNVAIEIDSSNKRFSVEKLMEMERRGFQCVWVRWNCPVRVIPHPNIHLIDLYPIDEPLEPQ